MESELIKYILASLFVITGVIVGLIITIFEKNEIMKAKCFAFLRKIIFPLMIGIATINLLISLAKEASNDDKKEIKERIFKK